MDNVGYLTLSLAAMKERALDVTANNMANANTQGFRSAKTSFDKMIVDTGSPGDLAKMSYSIDRGTYNDLSEGSLVKTGNPLDMAVQGDGYFGYQRRDGRIALGRDGSFSLSPEGDLLTSSGHAVLDAGGGPINIPPDAGQIFVGSDGTISTDQGTIVGRVGVFEEPDIALWQRLDAAMFVPREEKTLLTPALSPQVRQGFVEQSNVVPVVEMSNLISTQRAYERAMNIANGADKLRSELLQRLGRTS